MATQPVDKDAVRALYDQWVEAGRPQVRKFSRDIGRPEATVRRWLTEYAVGCEADAAESQAVRRGFAPDLGLGEPLPAPLVLTGMSTMTRTEEGLPRWIKVKVDEDKVAEAMRAAVIALAEGMPRAKPAGKLKKVTNDQLCTLYTLTDCHVGMKAWAPETGADWDLDIAERVLTGAVKYLVDTSPASATGVINQLGDFLHFDSLAPVTPTSGHLLDADSRYSKVVAVATRILRFAIDYALTKHKRVVVVMAEGNHDMASSVWLRHLFGLLYENEPRVEVINSELPYYVYLHGSVMLCFHHGHLKKNDQLPLLFAAQYPREWGTTTKRYCHTGHLHHAEEKEHSGMTVVQHPTIASRDAYAARYGWMAESRMRSIIYHQAHGEAGTITVTPEMLETA